MDSLAQIVSHNILIIFCCHNILEFSGLQHPVFLLLLLCLQACQESFAQCFVLAGLELSLLLTFYWPNQITWPDPISIGCGKYTLCMPVHIRVMSRESEEMNIITKLPPTAIIQKSVVIAEASTNHANLIYYKTGQSIQQEDSGSIYKQYQPKRLTI